MFTIRSTVKGEAIVIVLDVGKSMHKDKIYLTALEEAKEIIKMFIQRKIFSEAKDEIALILFGCNGASDMTDENSTAEFENISIVQSLQLPNWKLFDLVMDIEGTDISTDLIREHALETAINLLQSSVNGKKMDSRRILFLSNFDGYLDTNKINMMCDEMKANKITMNVMGPKSIKPVKEEGQDVIHDKSHISAFVREVNGESYSFSYFKPLLTYYQMKNVQPFPSNGTLEIGSLTIPIRVIIKVTESKPKKWEIACAFNVKEKPKRITTFCMNDESQTKVSFEDIIPAYKYGTTLVPFSEDDKRNMDYQPGGKGMKLLGFCKPTYIPRHFYGGDKSRYVFAEKNNESAAEALAAFIHALCEKNMVAIVRYVSTARSAPIMGFLSPRTAPNYECLIFIALPFMEDLRHFAFTPLDADQRNIPTENQLSAVDDLITAMDLTDPVDPYNEEVDILNPQKTVNPYVQRMFRCLQYRAYHPEKPLPEMEPDIQAILNPLPEILERAEPALKKINSLFPIKENVQKKLPDAKSHLLSVSKSEESCKIQMNPKTIMEDVSEAKFNIMDTVSDKITQVGSINPVRDIQYLINNQILPFNEICDQIDDVLTKLMEEKDHLKFNYPKILSICKEYRCSSIKEANCENYNRFMLSLEKDLLEIGELGDKIRNDKITLISNEQLPSSTVSSDEAEMFLSKPCLQKNTEHSIKTTVPCDGGGGDDEDEDDLMDQL